MKPPGSYRRILLIKLDGGSEVDGLESIREFDLGFWVVHFEGVGKNLATALFTVD